MSLDQEVNEFFNLAKIFEIGIDWSDNKWDREKNVVMPIILDSPRRAYFAGLVFCDKRFEEYQSQIFESMLNCREKERPNFGAYVLTKYRKDRISCESLEKFVEFIISGEEDYNLKILDDELENKIYDEFEERIVKRILEISDDRAFRKIVNHMRIERYERNKSKIIEKVKKSKKNEILEFVNLTEPSRIEENEEELLDALLENNRDERIYFYLNDQLFKKHERKVVDYLLKNQQTCLKILNDDFKNERGENRERFNPYLPELIDNIKEYNDHMYALLEKLNRSRYNSYKEKIFKIILSYENENYNVIKELEKRKTNNNLRQEIYNESLRQEIYNERVKEYREYKNKIKKLGPLSLVDKSDKEGGMSTPHDGEGGLAVAESSENMVVVSERKVPWRRKIFGRWIKLMLYCCLY